MNNTQQNSVHGWLDFGGDYGVRLELTGNLAGQMNGKKIRFHVAGREQDLYVPCDPVESLQDRQIGSVGTVMLRNVRVATYSSEEAVSLYIEWFSQNGRVVAEMVNVVATSESNGEVLTPEPLPEIDEDFGPRISGFIIDADGNVDPISFPEAVADDLDDDPYQLFPEDLEDQLLSSNPESLFAESDFDAPDESADRQGLRPWDEVIPGIDPETKRMYEEWDEVLHGEKDELLSTLFDPPLKLKPAAEVTDEAEANALLQPLLAQCALRSVAIDVCPHFGAVQTYRWLLDKILPDAQVHPNMTPTGYVMHYSTHEFCPQCEAEFDAEWEKRRREEGQSGDENDEPPAPW